MPRQVGERSFKGAGVPPASSENRMTWAGCLVSLRVSAGLLAHSVPVCVCPAQTWQFQVRDITMSREYPVP